MGRRQQPVSSRRREESTDPDVIAATMAKPGIVLRRPVGSNGVFTDHAALPTDLGHDTGGRSKERRAKAKKEPLRKVDDKAAHKAALEYERAEKQRESERRKEEAASEKERQRREQATAKAMAALEKAEREHESIAGAIEAEREALEKRSQTEDARWEREKQKLDAALRRARE